MSKKLRPGPGGVAGLVAERGSTRVRLRGPAAEGAIHTGYDVWGPVDYYFSELGERYLRGEVKGVITSLPAKFRTAFTAFNIVPTPPAQRAEKARRHRHDLLIHLQFQYKNAIAHVIADGNPRRADRLRHAANRALGTNAPNLAETERHFADHPAAIEAASEIKALWQKIALDQPS